MKKLKIEYVDINSIKPYEKNAVSKSGGFEKFAEWGLY